MSGSPAQNDGRVSAPPGFVSADSPGPGPAWEGSAEAATPLAAALILGLGIPQQHADRVRQVMLHADPVRASEDEGMLAYGWNHDGVWIALFAHPGGSSRASCRIARITHTVDGELVRKPAALERAGEGDDV